MKIGQNEHFNAHPFKPLESVLVSVSASVWKSTKRQMDQYSSSLLSHELGPCIIIKFSTCLHLKGLVFHATKCNVTLTSTFTDYWINMIVSMTLCFYSVFFCIRTWVKVHLFLCLHLLLLVLTLRYIKLLRDLSKEIIFCQISDRANNFCRDFKKLVKMQLPQ